jgi:hypothetical protein
LISHGSYPGMVYQSQQYFGFPYKEDPEQPEFGASWSNLWNVLAPRVQQDPLSAFCAAAPTLAHLFKNR